MSKLTKTLNDGEPEKVYFSTLEIAKKLGYRKDHIQYLIKTFRIQPAFRAGRGQTGMYPTRIVERLVKIIKINNTPHQDLVLEKIQDLKAIRSLRRQVEDLEKIILDNDQETDALKAEISKLQEFLADAYAQVAV